MQYCMQLTSETVINDNKLRVTQKFSAKVTVPFIFFYSFFPSMDFIFFEGGACRMSLNKFTPQSMKKREGKGYGPWSPSKLQGLMGFMRASFKSFGRMLKTQCVRKSQISFWLGWYQNTLMKNLSVLSPNAKVQKA